MAEKVTGYFLLIVGLCTIVFALLNVYFVFTKKSKPVELFKFESISINLGSLISAPDNATPEQKAAVESQKAKVKPTEIMSADLINQTSNIAAHMFLMGFVVTAGYKIGSLGIELLRPVNVRLRENKEEKPPVVKSA